MHEFNQVISSTEFVQEGIYFKGMSVEEMVKFFGEECRYMFYIVEEQDIEDTKVIHLVGEAIGEKAYYLLTVIIQEYKGLTRVVLRAHSDNKYGLNGFLSEMIDSIPAQNIGFVGKKHVTNIIDSVINVE